MDIIPIQLRQPSFPRCCYLVKNLETAQRFLKSAFILRGMKWHKIQNFRHLIPGIKAEIDRVSPRVSDKEFFQSVYPFTMIPVSTFPTPRGHRIKSNDLRRTDPPYVLRHGRRKYRQQHNNSPQMVLMEAMRRAGVKIESHIYDTPCSACLKLFEHVAGACSLVQRGNTGELSICHMDILASSNALMPVTEVLHPSKQLLPAID